MCAVLRNSICSIRTNAKTIRKFSIDWVIVKCWCSRMKERAEEKANAHKRSNDSKPRTTKAKIRFIGNQFFIYLFCTFFSSSPFIDSFHRVNLQNASFVFVGLVQCSQRDYYSIHFLLIRRDYWFKRTFAAFVNNLIRSRLDHREELEEKWRENCRKCGISQLSCRVNRWEN